jgi:hypothetical protein
LKADRIGKSKRLPVNGDLFQFYNWIKIPYCHAAGIAFRLKQYLIASDQKKTG